MSLVVSSPGGTQAAPYWAAYSGLRMWNCTNVRNDLPRVAASVTSLSTSLPVCTWVSPTASAFHPQLPPPHSTRIKPG
eukprot:9765916-Alexandrium_andersonii.AAC.1